MKSFRTKALEPHTPRNRKQIQSHTLPYMALSHPSLYGPLTKVSLTFFKKRANPGLFLIFLFFLATIVEQNCRL